MKTLIALTILAPALAFADDPPKPAPAPADDGGFWGDGLGSGTPAPAPTPDPAPTPAPDATPAPAPTSAPTPAPDATPPAPAPTPPPTSVAPNDVQGAPAKKEEVHERADDYYNRARGIGMFHSGRLAIGAMQGQAAALSGDGGAATPGMTKSSTIGEIAFEGVYLGLPSTYGHFHGIEISTGLRGSPVDFWLTGGTAVSLFNIGRGGPGSLRVGGSFGAGFDLAHAYGYVRGRAAIVLIPAKLDAEASVLWSPASAGTGNFDEVEYRVSAWYRPAGRGGSERAYELFVQSFKRTDAMSDNKREFSGAGGGLGMTLF